MCSKQAEQEAVDATGDDLAAIQKKIKEYEDEIETAAQVHDMKMYDDRPASHRHCFNGALKNKNLEISELWHGYKTKHCLGRMSQILRKCQEKLHSPNM